ncbi:Estrogen-related receptor gamma [Sarcoptes scabiei]|nr:Estrogen-related receptor gamma [Sarcoptes scabiei]
MFVKLFKNYATKYSRLIFVKRFILIQSKSLTINPNDVADDDGHSDHYQSIDYQKKKMFEEIKRSKISSFSSSFFSGNSRFFRICHIVHRLLDDYSSRLLSIAIEKIQLNVGIQSLHSRP